ncbi:MAG: flavodoxin domain-containing protein [Marinilabiliaceae bacterium]|jgi:menaquinone-dependent protoporphyrinogen IX oxidase|nr:flavodoxin domain-containing protein [Marinilabiliaceae bacterium]
MKTIVIYYSNKGSNKYLAKKISQSLSCELEEIKPRLNIFLLFLMNIHLGIKAIKTNIGEYDRVVLCGPIWMGKLIPPLRSFINKYFDRIHKLVFVSSCGSTYEKKDEKFGHGLVFKEVESILKDKCVFCQAFPIDLVLPDDKKEDTDAFMKTHLNDDNFKGEIQERFEAFIKKVNSNS